jgi:hypothetical protein
MHTLNRPPTTDAGLALGFQVKAVPFPKPRTYFDSIGFTSIDRLPLSELLKIYPPKTQKTSKTLETGAFPARK